MMEPYWVLAGLLGEDPVNVVLGELMMEPYWELAGLLGEDLVNIFATTLNSRLLRMCMKCAYVSVGMHLPWHTYGDEKKTFFNCFH